MATFSFKPGAAAPLGLQVMADDGVTPSPPQQMQLRIESGATCITVQGVLDAVEQAFFFDLNGLTTLAPSLYPAAVYSDYGDGYQREEEIYLEVKGGC